MPIQHPHRQIAHEIKALETYIYEQLEALPTIDNVLSEKDTHERCAHFHSTCSDCLRPILEHVSMYSGRLATLITSIWDIASMNVLVLMKLCYKLQYSLREKDDGWKKQIQIYEKRQAQHDVLAIEFAEEKQAFQMEIRELKAANRALERQCKFVNDENTYLRRLLEKLSDSTKEKLDSDSDSEEEEHLHLVNADDIRKFKEVDPLDSSVSDFNALFDSIIQDNQTQLRTLSEIDRFMNSSLVSVLWRHQPSSADRFLEKLMNLKSVSTQTSALVDDNAGHNGDDHLDTRSICTDDADDPKTKSSNTQHTKAEARSVRANRMLTVLPRIFQGYIQSQPKVAKVLPKKQLLAIALQLFLEKLEKDKFAYEQNIDRMELAPFMIQSFTQKYGLHSLAEYHIVELLKSCRYYRQEVANAAALFQEDKTGSNLSIEDCRIFLLGRLCGLFEKERLSRSMEVEGIGVVTDLLGDLLEVDPSIKSLEQLLNPERHFRVEINREVCALVLTAHLDFLDHERIETFVRDVRNAPQSESSDPSKISLDWVLARFLGAWCEDENGMEQRMRIVFYDTICKRPSGDIENDRPMLSVAEFTEAVLELDDDNVCSEANVQELFNDILLRRRLKGNPKRRQMRKASRVNRQKRMSEAEALLVYGIKQDVVSEREFIVHAGHFLRSRRPRHGIRTGHVPIFDPATGTFIGGMGRPHRMGMEIRLKPGLPEKITATIVKAIID